MNDPIAARLEALLDPGRPDWADVQRRARYRLATGQRRRRRILLAAAALAAAGVVVGAAVAASGWLTGTPAPQSVKSDFGTYTPQLGFHPQPGNSALVASDGDNDLYATTNTEGSYCIVLSTPLSRPPQSMGGGYCIGTATADQPIVAGVFPASPDSLLLAGRVSVSDATAVQAQLPDGSSRKIQLASSGFFLASIEGKPCQHGTWSPQLLALNSVGTTVAASTITLEEKLAASAPAVPSACALGMLTSEKAPSVEIKP